jgi:MoxR-like ATPase
VTDNVRRMHAAEFMQPTDLKFVDVFKLQTKFEKMFGQPNPPNLILSGPSGVAKSLAVRKFAADNKIPVIVAQGSEDARRHHLIGMRAMEKDSTPFILGTMTNAIEVANEVGKAIFLVDEINAYTPQLQKLFNGLTEDFGRFVTVEELSSVYRVNSACRLWVVGTMNTGTGYGGVFPLNYDLKRRFRIVPLTYPLKVDEQKIIDANVTPAPSPDVREKVLNLAAMTRTGAVGYALSPSDVVHILQDTAVEGLKEALRNVSGKFEGVNRETFDKQVSSIFSKL